MKKTTGIALLVLVLGCIPSANAGILFLAGTVKDDAFSPASGTVARQGGVAYSTIQAVVEAGTALTSVECSLRAPADLDSMVCVIPFPPEIAVSGVKARLVSDGQSRDLLPVLMTPAKAQTLYETAAKALNRPSVLANSGRQAVCIPMGRAGKKAVLTVEFRQGILTSSGLSQYVCPTPDTSLSGEPIEKFSFTATLKPADPLRTVLCTTHAVRVERVGLKEARVEARTERYTGSADLVLQFVADPDPMGLRVVSHRTREENEGYFLLVANPTGSEKADAPVPKDLVFVLDTSGSMRGEKMEQARAAIEYCLDNLNEGDRFSLISFGTDVASFRPEAVAATAAAVKQAKAFLDELEPTGRTNIGDALAKGLAGETEKGRMRIMLFLTDGAPTAGELIPDRIIEQATAANRSGTRIYVFGLGTDVDARLLGRIAENAQGVAEFLRPEEEIDVKVAALYNRLSNPMLSDVVIDFGGLAVSALYPRQVTTLFKGCDLMLFGRYRGGGKHTVTVSGRVAGETRTYRYEVDFPGEEQVRDDYVATLWATRRIGHLMQEIRLNGQNRELVDEIVRLGRQFGIITEYTAFLADARKMPSATAAPSLAMDSMKAAHREIGGKWAVAQARNERKMQEQVVAESADVNAYEDRSGQEKRESRLSQVGRRTFLQKDDGSWVEGAGQTNAPGTPVATVRKVKLMSDDYLRLVRENRDFAEAQKLGAKIEMDIKGERIQVVE